MGDATVAQQRGGPVRRWLTGLSLSKLWQLAILTVLAVTALFGGLATVDKHVTVAEVGKPFSNGQFTITIERATSFSAGPSGSVMMSAKPGVRYLGVVATVRNDGTIPGSLMDQLRLQHVPDAEEIVPRRLSDSEPLTSIGAGLTEEVAFFWSVPAAAIPPGTPVTLEIWKKEFRELIITYGKAWVASTKDYVRIEVPVRYQP